MKYLLTLLSLVFSLSAIACNFGSVHPVLWHYNQMDKVFLGTVEKIGDPTAGGFNYIEKATNIPTYKIRLKVENSYRGDMPEVIEIGKRALAKLAFAEGETYLVYAEYDENDQMLVTGSILHVLDPRMSRHEILKEIGTKKNGTFTEYSANGEVWATGSMENGIPTGVWNYYEITGELKESGEYKNGKRHGNWEQYYFTDQKWFTFFEAVAAGKAGRYQLIEHKTVTDPKSPYRYELTYTDLSNEKEYTSPYLYKKPLVQRRAKYKNGLLNGKEKFYNDHGELTGVVKWKENTKNGKYWYKTIQFTEDGVRMESVFKGVYVQDQVKDETVYYFENGKLQSVEETFKNFEM